MRTVDSQMNQRYRTYDDFEELFPNQDNEINEPFKQPNGFDRYENPPEIPGDTQLRKSPEIQKRLNQLRKRRIK